MRCRWSGRTVLLHSQNVQSGGEKTYIAALAVPQASLKDLVPPLDDDMLFDSMQRRLYPRYRSVQLPKKRFEYGLKKSDEQLFCAIQQCWDIRQRQQGRKHDLYISTFSEAGRVYVLVQRQIYRAEVNSQQRQVQTHSRLSTGHYTHPARTQSLHFVPCLL